ncbi:MAG TPA: metalloregulator ArsR/SmtB family transcription factor [Bacteroidales bacterium]|nr:metalloregulator ArsR/SmtB family transcription factor [Bacteroidales bacterium]
MTDYKETDIRLARYYKALSHPARIAILSHLNQVGRCIGKDLVELLPLSQATVSQHLRELTKAGLVRTKNAPPSTIYMINKEKWDKARSMITGLLNMKS